MSVIYCQFWREMRHAQSCPWPLLHNLCKIVFNNENVQMKWRRPAVNYNGTSVEVSDKTPSKKASKDIQTQVQWLDSDFLRWWIPHFWKAPRCNARWRLKAGAQFQYLPSYALLRVTFCVVISFFRIKGTTVFCKFQLHVLIQENLA